MKILIENESFKFQGGSETIAIHTYEILKKNGHEVFFFSTNNSPYYIKNYKYSRYFPRYIKSTKEYLKNPIAYYWNRQAGIGFEKMIAEIKPDIIHLNLLISPSILSVCKKMNIPTVVTVHVPTPFCPANTFMLKNKEFCTDFKCKNGNYWYCILNRCGNNSLERSIRKALLSFIYNKTNAYSDVKYFICPSNALRDYVRLSNLTKEKNKIITINNFLSDEEVNTQPNYNNQGYFLYIGRLSKEKGVQYLLSAMKQLPRDIKLHIVGSGSEEQDLKKIANQHNLKNIEFLGFKNREEIKEEYQNCIATILPCNWFENFPTTNMESFINGKPVIASNIGGIPEQVENDKTGLLFEPANVEQLKDCILKYWNNPKLVIEHGKNGYNKAKEQYTEKRYYQELIKIYEEII